MASCVAESKFIPVGGNPPSSSNIFRLNRKVWADFAIPVRQERVAAGGVLCYIFKYIKMCLRIQPEESEGLAS